MGTNCAPLVADVFLFCYERDFKTLYLSILKRKSFVALTKMLFPSF